MKRVLVNKIRCKQCNDIIESIHRHDFKRCKCGSIFIDGGKDYQRFGWGGNQPKDAKIEDFIDFSYSDYEGE
ncbi:hypothetical protein SAMN04487944_11319 [Gracilibacillus ureilyticus]|uniref:DUF7695 domain-containing protein n=1 Tax=Gracilibacillus ureilyticus TaxID=531814 RepID=A0A1H9T743_9BACI|nr:hypothetical protein [Gracilibacillus ureilyticus]SER93075.1 hypothetical protein SAMN04487944_11319 [Gracilibacillus ureilyticus]